MVISQPPGNNPSYYYRASLCLNCSDYFQRHLMFYTCNYNIRVTHRNGAIKHIFYESDPRRDHQQIISLFILSLHALALHLAVKYYFKSFCMKIWARWPYIHLSVVFPARMPAGPHFVTQPILLSENILIFDINHQQNTRRSDQDWNDKNDNANYAPSYHMEGFTNGSGCHFKEIFDQVRKDLDCELFYSIGLKRHNVSHYIYYLATDNIHIVLRKR